MHEKTVFEREHLENVKFFRVGIAFEKHIWLVNLHDLSKTNYYQQLLLKLYVLLLPQFSDFQYKVVCEKICFGFFFFFFFLSCGYGNVFGFV